MLDSIQLNKRIEKGEELTWQEVDTNWQLIQTAVNYWLSSNWQKDYEAVAAGELVVTHNYGLLPKSVTVWQKVTSDRWIPIATPDVSYLDDEYTEVVRINFAEAPGTIKVIIKF